jgi:general secretion pathway protein E/type IV pilus assembly protein PilB
MGMAAQGEKGWDELLRQMVEARQLSALDAQRLKKELAESGNAPAPSEEFVLRWIAQQYGLPFLNIEQIETDKELLSLFPARVLLKEGLLPLRRVDGWVEVATSRILATQGLDILRAMTGMRVRPVLATSEAIQREIKKRLGIGADTIDTLEEEAAIQVVDEGEEETDLDKAAEDASIIRFVNQVLKDAIELRASDIHIEPFEDELRIRYRIDGVLQEVPVPPQIKRFQAAIVSRVKIMSHLNIAEKRVPQDGRIKLKIENEEVDVRVSVIPMIHGEAVVLRLLRQSGLVIRGIHELGMDERELRLFRRILTLPHGIVLVTGPTGSGKTTTLYTALNEINDASRKIITIEDPVEYQLKGVNQIQVSEKAGLTFARGLRAILRHDPDVILVGEIRDLETAQIAIQASLTGHLVFSTLHTNDAPSALTRLVDMGVEPYLVSSSLEGVIAQRLVRVLCPHCKEPDDSPPVQAFKAIVGFPPDTVVYQAVGCRECRGTGYFGRHAIFEFMEITNEIRRMVLQNRSADELREAARAAGMRTLAEDGWRLVRAGITTPAEVLRVTKDQNMVGGFDEDVAAKLGVRLR